MQQYKFVCKTPKAVYECLSKQYLKTPSTKEEWFSISKELEETRD